MRIQTPRPITPLLCFGIAKSAFAEIAGSGRMIRPYSFQWVGFIAGVTLVQYLAVRLGLEMGIAHGNVSPVWPATGFAIAVLLRLGVNLWPGIALGSFLGLAQTGLPIPFVIGEAAAALLEAVTAVWFIRRWIAKDDPLTRTRDVVRFCILAGCAATAISATAGVGVLCLGGLTSWTSFGYLWGTWWLGDVMGALIVAPFLIIWTNTGIRKLDHSAWIKTGVVFVLLMVAGVVAFWGPFVSSTGVSDYPIAFLTLPMVVSAAFLAGRRGATAACIICSTMAILGTARGLGPFFRGSVNESLLLLQSYLVVISVTSIILAAVLNERDGALQALRHSRDDLEHRIADRTKEIVASNSQLKREVVERKQAEEALRESEEKYRTVVEESFDGVFVHDGSTVTFANSRFHKMMGYDQGELYGMNPVMICQPDFRELTQERAQARLKGESVPQRYELGLVRKDRTAFPGEINAKVVVFDDKPQVQVWVRDLTEQKLLEKRLVEGQKLEAVGILAGGIAHDFNNLLQIISGHAELLQIQLANRGMKFDEMTAILRASDRGAELVKQILTFSRRVNTEFASVNLNEDVYAAELLLSRTIPKMIDIELRLEEDLLPVRADSTQIQQLLINLAVNAKDAMPEGGTLTIETRNIGVDEQHCAQHGGRAPGRYVLLRVSDTGHGMEQEVLGHMYEPFFTTKGLAQGTGLGLATVFGIVKMHRGHITCESEVGKGTTFEISFPVAEPDTQSPVRLSEKPEVEGGTETILVVDDEDLIQELAKRILEKSGYKVLTAGSGKEAIEMYAEHRSEISLVILDLIMPEMGGKQCLDELLKIDPRVKALVSTGLAIEEDAKAFFEAKAKGKVSKPFNGGELLRTVRRIIDST